MSLRDATVSSVVAFAFALAACGSESASSPGTGLSSGTSTADGGGVAKDCTRLAPLRAWSVDPSAVAVLFTPENCGTRVPLTGLTNADFEVVEDGEPLSSEAHREVLTGRGFEVELDLLLDVSDSTLPVRGDVVAGARSVVDELLLRRGLASKVRIGLWVFDGSSAPTPLQYPVSDIERLHSRLDSLRSYQSTDGGATNLNGALRQGVADLQKRLVARMVDNAGGIATTGHLIVFTDGGDSAGREGPRAATTAVAAARTATGTSRAPAGVVSTWAVTLRGGDYDSSALQELVGTDPRYLLEAGAASELSSKFGAVAGDIAAQVEGTYLFAYCSSKRAGTHTVKIRLRDGIVSSSEDLSFDFSAEGFQGGCNAAFFASACEDKQCGGLACGACAAEAEQCNPQSLQCRAL